MSFRDVVNQVCERDRPGGLASRMGDDFGWLAGETGGATVPPPAARKRGSAQSSPRRSTEIATETTTSGAVVSPNPGALTMSFGFDVGMTMGADESDETLRRDAVAAAAMAVAGRRSSSPQPFGAPPQITTSSPQTSPAGNTHHVTIVRARSLACAEEECDAFVELTGADGMRWETNEQPGTTSPLWRQDIAVPATPGGGEQRVALRVRNRRDGMLLGVAELAFVAAKLQEPYTEYDLPLQEQPDPGTRARLVVRVAGATGGAVVPESSDAQQSHRTIARKLSLPCSNASGDVPPGSHRLDVTVVRAKDVLPCLARAAGGAEPEAAAVQVYIEGLVGVQEYRTAVKSGSLYPVWCEHFRCILPPEEGLKGQLMLMNAAEEPPALIAKAALHIDAGHMSLLVSATKPEEFVLPLTAPGGEECGGATVVLKIKGLPT